MYLYLCIYVYTYTYIYIYIYIYMYTYIYIYIYHMWKRHMLRIYIYHTWLTLHCIAIVAKNTTHKVHQKQCTSNKTNHTLYISKILHVKFQTLHKESILKKWIYLKNNNTIHTQNTIYTQFTLKTQFTQKTHQPKHIKNRNTSHNIYIKQNTSQATHINSLDVHDSHTSHTKLNTPRTKIPHKL